MALTRLVNHSLIRIFNHSLTQIVNHLLTHAHLHTASVSPSSHPQHDVDAVVSPPLHVHGPHACCPLRVEAAELGEPGVSIARRNTGTAHKHAINDAADVLVVFSSTFLSAVDPPC